MEKFNTIKEEDVGITQYINDTNQGFKCVLKHRYSDFIVNEIDYTGNVIWIKDSNSSQLPEISSKSETPLTEEKALSIINTQFSNIINQIDIENLSTFISNYLLKQNITNDTIEINFIDDKQKRKTFHEALRASFPFLDSETKEDKNTKKKSLIVSYITKSSYYKRRKVFPDKSKTVLHCSMLKRNIDTVGAINYIARMLHIIPKRIKFAGNKDKRGITTQRLSFFQVLPNEIQSALKSKNWNKNIEIGNFCFSDSELRLGILKGNQFCVALRFVEINNIEQTLPSIIKSINDKGFVNYFGMQRFGVSNIPTHIIGKHIIKKQWKEAFIKLISTECVFDALRQLTLQNDIEKSIFAIDDSKKQMSIINDILKIIPKYTTEYKLLYNYVKSGKNSFKSSFNSLNRQLQVLYPHAYQSFLWNLTVSYRLSKHGKKLIIGDIVKKHSALYQERNQEEDCDAEDEGAKGDNNISNQNDNEKMDSIFTDNFEFINEDNINKFSFGDLVIPLVGSEVYYPKNDTKDFIEEMLKKDTLTFKDFEYQSVNFSSSGYFRKVIERPMNEMKFDIINHDDPDEDLQSEYYNIMPHPNAKGTKYTSIRIIFQLPQSTYATMLFRELTKHSSASNYQANLSLNMSNE